MAEGRNRQLWDHTSSVLAMLANGLLSRKKGQPPFGPRDFNPFELAKRDEAVIRLSPKKSLDLLIAMYDGKERN